MHNYFSEAAQSAAAVDTLGQVDAAVEALAEFELVSSVGENAVA